MVLAVGFEADVAQHDHLVVAVGLLEGSLQDFDGVLEISCEPFLVGADDAIGRAEQTLARGIVARPAQQRAHGLLRLLACRALARPLRGRLGHGGSSFRAGAEAGVS